MRNNIFFSLEQGFLFDIICSSYGSHMSCCCSAPDYFTEFLIIAHKRNPSDREKEKLSQTSDETVVELYCGENNMFVCFLCAPAEDLWAKQQKRTFSGALISSADYKVLKNGQLLEKWDQTNVGTCDAHMGQK